MEEEFFFVSGYGWEYPVGEVIDDDYPRVPCQWGNPSLASEIFTSLIFP